MSAKTTFLIFLFIVVNRLSSYAFWPDRSNILSIEMIYSKTFQVISNDSLQYEYLLTILDKSRSVDSIYNYIHNSKIDTSENLTPLCGCSSNISFYEIVIKLDSDEKVKIDINKCGEGFETGYIYYGDKRFKIKFSKNSEKKIKAMFSETIKKKSEKVDLGKDCK